MEIRQEIMTYPTKKLGEVLDYEQPGKYIVHTKNYSDSYKTPVLTPGKKFILGYTDESDCIYSAELPIIIFDDFTTASRLVDFKFKVKSSALKILHAKRSLADINYIYYLMQCIEVNHNTHKRYWISEFSKKDIPLPSLPEQKKIVKKIEQLFAKIDEAQKLRGEALLDAAALIPAALNQIFEKGKKEGWSELLLNEVVQLKTVKNTKLNLPYVGMEDVESNTGKFLGSKDSKSVKSTTFIFDNNSILYGKLRPYLNKVLIPDFEGHCSTEFIPIEPNKNILIREWLAYWIMNEKIVKRANSTSTGTRMPRANMKEVVKFIIPLPPLPEQKKIVVYLDSLSEKAKALQELQKQTAEDMNTLKKSILHKAFEGELVK
jgi:type I restriction enzyme S subunit